MLGTNRDEMKLFMALDPRWVNTHLWGLLIRVEDPERYAAVSHHTSAMWKAAGADEPAAALVRGEAPGVYVYRFDWDEEPTLLGTDLAALLGAAHAFEIPFVFGHWDLGGRANVIFTDDNAGAREALARQTMSYWAAFAYDGNPGRGRDGQLTEWSAAPKFMVLDTEAGGGVRMSDGTLSEENALSALQADPRLATPEKRCDALRATLAMAGRLGNGSPSRYGCPDAPANES
jgi:para-nitrobenzyl esterase